MKLPLAVLLIAGGALGLVLPGTNSASDPAPAGREVAAMAGGQDAQYVAAAQTLANGTPNWSEPVTLYREDDGHFYADVMVDGQTYRMLVDTGASVVALTGDDAARMGITWDESELGPIARSASGVVEGVPTRIDRMTIGGLEASQVSAIIIPEGAGISLLGQSFLSTIGKVEIADDRMVLGS